MHISSLIPEDLTEGLRTRLVLMRQSRSCMYVCMYVCMYGMYDMYVYVYMYVYMYVYVCMYVCPSIQLT